VNFSPPRTPERTILYQRSNFADQFVGMRLQPFRIEDEARKITNTNFIVASRFKPYAVREGRLVTGQQQYSGTAAARLIIEALGV
jgi:hypothetical protein